MEPPVSLPRASGAKPAATAAALPSGRATRDPVQATRVAGGAETPSVLLRSPLRTRPCSSCRSGRPRPRQAFRQPWRRTVAPSRQGFATSTWWARRGCTAGPSTRPAHRRGGPGRRRRRPNGLFLRLRAERAWSSMTRLKAWTSGSTFGDAGEVVLQHRCCLRPAPGGHCGPARCRGSAGRAGRRSRGLAQDARDPEAVVFYCGCL